MQLCGHSVSPYFERIMMALDMKGQLGAVPRADVPDGFKSEAHFRYHPLGKIPFLILDDDSSITESQVIVDFLDAKLEGPRLTPTDPLSAARASQIIRAMDIYYVNAIAPMGRAAFGGKATDEELAFVRETTLPQAFRYVSALIAGDTFAVGSGWTTADATIMSHLYWYGRLAPQFDMPSLADYAPLAAYWENVSASQIYQDSKARADASVKKFFESRA